ncbi:hypothetical protein [Emticicia sp. 21SJ11W-3]|uniref:hypothetical protein n=1 Tax=Emticicia sp. 21SJ11W-3 TaxID=2916755 RepID=UPI00209E6360|nr:hypothetical protein [Emticicia sp. 21SJ11W-3]UTA68491.1 hypothetical protein MB380_01485 [Emticicia sp. 21SJ11W-3]
MNKQLMLSSISFIFLCSSCESYEFSNLQLIRQGWDTLQIETGFTKKALFEKKVALPTNEQITLSTPSKGIFYRGSSHSITLPDRDLPSEAEITVQVEVEFENGEILKEQRTIKASPKRYSMTNKIEFPLGDATDKLGYQILIDKKRPLLEGSSDFETFESGMSFPTTLKLFLDNDPTVLITLTPQDADGIFDLNQSSQFRAFESNLQRNISQQMRVELHVEAVSTIDGREYTFKLNDIVFEQKTREQQITYCREIGENITSFLQKKISPNTGRNTIASISEESCTYDPIRHKYSFSIICSWESRMFNNPWSDYRTFKTWGAVSAYDNGKWEFLKEGVNSALRDSDDYEQVLGGIIVGAAVVNALSNHNQ